MRKERLSQMEHLSLSCQEEGRCPGRRKKGLLSPEKKLKERHLPRAPHGLKRGPLTCHSPIRST